MKKLDISEKEYRALDILSYSSIKDFINDRKAFYKKHILKIDDSTEDINQVTDSGGGKLLIVLDFFRTKSRINQATHPTG